MAKAKILLIEDSQDYVEMLSFQLRHGGSYRVTAVNTGEEGLEKAYQQLPDLIILDLRLPGMHGLEVLKQLKADSRTADIPVIVLTVVRDLEAVYKAGQAHANDYVIKSEGIDDLVSLIQKHITLSRAEKKKRAEIV
jgi:CheY-like chemotaxis protein